MCNRVDVYLYIIKNTKELHVLIDTPVHFL